MVSGKDDDQALACLSDAGAHALNWLHLDAKDGEEWLELWAQRMKAEKGDE